MCRLKHRGPDWSGLHCYEDCYLAHERLAIIDPTSGDQPLLNEDKSIVVTVLLYKGTDHFVTCYPGGNMPFWILLTHSFLLIL